MSKQSSVAALMKKGVGEDLAGKMVDKGYTVTSMDKKNMEKMKDVFTKAEYKAIRESFFELTDGIKPAEATGAKATAGDLGVTTEKGIVWCIDDNEADPYLAHFKKSKKVAWGTNFAINTTQFELPMVGYVYVKGEGVKYRAVIEDIQPSEADKKVSDIPSPLKDAKFQTYLKLTQLFTLDDYIPLEKFENPQGEPVKSARNYTQILNKPLDEILTKSGTKPTKGDLAILWSVGDPSNLPQYQDALAEKGGVLWGANFPINTKQFKYPLTSYLFIKGEGVLYKAVISDVDSDEAEHAPKEPALIPESLKDAKFPTFLKITAMEKLAKPLALSDFRTPKGDIVKSARNYTQVISLDSPMAQPSPGALATRH